MVLPVNSQKLLLIQQRYNFESNSQLTVIVSELIIGCCLYSKDTISRAIHNYTVYGTKQLSVVAYTAKIQFREQFTTNERTIRQLICCCLYSKDTISRAIHNSMPDWTNFNGVVAYTAKIQFREQFTTEIFGSYFPK